MNLTSAQLSAQLKERGINYGDSAVRAAWRKGAPRDVTSFIGWLALATTSRTGASMAAAEAAGLGWNDDDDDSPASLTVASSAHGLALLAEIFRSSGAEFFFASWPAVWMTLRAMEKDRECGVKFPEFADPALVEEFMKASNALCEITMRIVPMSQKLTAAGIFADATPWLALAKTHSGKDRLEHLARGAYGEFQSSPVVEQVAS